MMNRRHLGLNSSKTSISSRMEVVSFSGVIKMAGAISIITI